MKNLVAEAVRLHRQAGERVVEEKGRLKAASRHALSATSAQDLIQQAAQTVQQMAHDKIAAVVTKCLTSVFDEPYEFRIEFLKKRGRTEARLTFLKDGKEEDPLDGSGGGILDVASLALRLACLMLNKPRGRKLLVLDEPFKNVNGTRNRERAARLIETLAEDFGLQIIMTTGYDWLRIGKVVELT